MGIFSRVFRNPDATRDSSAAFHAARTLAATRNVVVVRPDLSLLALACPAPDSMPSDVVQQMEGIVPSSVKRSIAVITPTAGMPSLAKAEVGSPAWTEVGRTIPFFGLLNGLSYIGHTVWAFDPASAVEAGCKDADVVIIDSVVADSSLDAVRQVMRDSSIFIHDRATFRLQPAAAEPAGWAEVFEKARACTAQGQIALIQPERTLLGLSCIPRKAMTSSHLAQAHLLIPEGIARNVAVIAPTRLAPDASDAGLSPAVARLRAAGRAIPFFGLLLNLASAGNPVCVFEGNDESVAFGCRGADLLFIDSVFANQLTTRTVERAAGVMRSENIGVYDRGSNRIRLLRHVGPSQDKLEFRG